LFLYRMFRNNHSRLAGWSRALLKTAPARRACEGRDRAGIDVTDGRRYVMELREGRIQSAERAVPTFGFRARL